MGLRCNTCITCSNSNAQTFLNDFFFYTCDSAWLFIFCRSVFLSCFIHYVFQWCTNLCHLSIKGKVSLFAVSLLSQTDQNHSEWRANKQKKTKNDKNPTCKPLKMHLSTEILHYHKWKEWKCTGCFCKLHIIRQHYRLG